MRLDHVANRLTAASFDTVVALLCRELGFVELRRTESAVWLRQPGTNVDLQFCRSASAPTRDADRARSQVAFLSEAPRADLEALADAARGAGLDVVVGAYTDREFFLDAPEAFVDFVIEAMLPELAEYGMDV